MNPTPPSSPAPGAIAPPASVVVPVYGRLDLLMAVLSGFAREAEQEDFELVLVDDGSEPPVRTALAQLEPLPFVRLLEHATNQGRGAALNTGIAAARGSVVIVCDADVVPAPGFVREHLDFHRVHTSELATHLGALEWGVDAGLFGDLLGARSNPRVGNAPRSIGWTTWYTDNWSFKRRLLAERGMRFDPAFRAWGWEELELARRLAQLGATNRLTGTARGLHLKPATPEGLARNFARSVPNLLHLARQAPDDPDVRTWLSCRVVDGGLLARMEACLAGLWRRIQDLDRDSTPAPELATLHAPLVKGLAVSFSDILFRVAIARGFQEHASPGQIAGAEPIQGLRLPPTSDEQQLLCLSTPLAQIVLAEALLLGRTDAKAFLDEALTPLALAPGQATRLLERVQVEATRSANALHVAA